MKAFQAYGTQGKITAETPRKAAETYFEEFPRSRKCNVIEGTIDGEFFVIRYGKVSEGRWPESYKDVTKKTVTDLPDN